LKARKSLKLVSLLSLGIVVAACNQPEKAEPEAVIDLEDNDTKVSYVIGVSSGQAMLRNLSMLDGTDIVIHKDVLIKAFADGVNEASSLDEEALQTVMNEFRGRVNTVMQEKRQQEQAEQEKLAAENVAKGAAFLEENKAKDGVVTLDSGLQYKVVEAGSGKSPAASDRVKVNYRGTLIDGTEFDSSFARGVPAEFGVGQVIKGWTEALQLMKEGGKWQLYIPAALAYGEASRPKIPGNSVLIFDVELLEVLATEDEAAKAK